MKKHTVTIALVTLLFAAASASAQSGSEIGEKPLPDTVLHGGGSNVNPNRTATSLRSVTSRGKTGFELDLKQPSSGNRTANTCSGTNCGRPYRVSDFFSQPPLLCIVFNSTVGEVYEIQFVCE